MLPSSRAKVKVLAKQQLVDVAAEPDDKQRTRLQLKIVVLG